MTTKLDSEPTVAEPDSLLHWLTRSLEELSLDAETIAVSSYDGSHRFLELSGRRYIIWDHSLSALAQWMLIGVQFDRLSRSLDGDASADVARYAESIFRTVLFRYLGRKLRRYPHTSAAFMRLAVEEQPTPPGDVPEGEVLLDLYHLQQMLMFYHEAAHAAFHQHPALHRDALGQSRELLGALRQAGLETGQFTNAELSLYQPELADLDSAAQFERYLEEFACDYQALALTARAHARSPVFAPRAWQDSFGFIYGASSSLAVIERTLKLSVLKWTEFAVETGDGAEITDAALELPAFLVERRMATVRRWYTILALQHVLKQFGDAAGVDAFEWQEYILAKFAGFTEALEEYALGGINKLANAEFIAKVFARASLHREASG